MRAKGLIAAVILVLNSITPVSAQLLTDPVRRGAVLRSLVLPGWGQGNLGADRQARRFLIAEAGLWLSFLTAYKGAQVYQEDYRAYATLHAGASSRIRPDIYYFRLGAYDNIYEYNQVQLRRRNVGALYLIGGDGDWDWDSSASREQYRDLRNTSLRLSKVASFAVSGMVLNRVLAAINVLFLTRAAPEAAWRPLPGTGGGELRLSWEF
ncbi:MAG: hypothetical protein V3W14_12415 [Candidatus Neomarinimicrobiota bacterium]